MQNSCDGQVQLQTSYGCTNLYVIYTQIKLIYLKLSNMSSKEISNGLESKIIKIF